MLGDYGIPYNRTERRFILAVVVATVGGLGLGWSWHALWGREVRARVVGFAEVQRSDGDHSTQPVTFPRVRFELDGRSEEAVVSNEFVSSDLVVGAELVAWHRGGQVIVKDLENDLLRALMVGALSGFSLYLAGAFGSLWLERRRRGR